MDRKQLHAMSTRRVRLFEMEKRELAIKFMTKMPDKDGENYETVWIPRSVIHHISRDLKNEDGNLTPCTVEVEEWFLEKNDL